MEALEQLDHGFYINTSYREYKMVHAYLQEKVSYRYFYDLKNKYGLKEENRENRAQRNLIS